MGIKIKINLGDLVLSMKNNDSWFDNYLDLKDGSIRTGQDDKRDKASVSAAELKEDPDRYLFIETFPSNEAYLLMEEFIEGLTDKKAKDNLVKAVTGNKPFRSFKNALQEFPEIRDEWYKFEDMRLKQYAAKWLNDNKIEFENI